MSRPHARLRSVFNVALVASLAALALILGTPAQARSNYRPKVEVVFVLDTTGSMGGLIQAAKQKIWSIVNELSQGQPRPEIRLGLVAYRDKGDQYVTQRTDLSADIDAVYGQLMNYRADGGGDGPEHVNQALFEAVHAMRWSQDRRALKLIFLVGDAPPHMDYQDDVKYTKVTRQAMRKDLIINTVQCGNDAQTKKIWRDIAHRSEGRYVAIAQDGGAVAVTTPYDHKLSELSTRLDSTYMTYGAAEEQVARKAKLMRSATLAAAAAPEAAAARSSFRARDEGAALGGLDFIADTRSGAVDMDGLAEDELPMELKGKNKAEQRALVQQKQAERKKIQKQIQELSQERSKYLNKAASAPGSSKDSFDAEVLDAVRSKAEAKGIHY